MSSVEYNFWQEYKMFSMHLDSDTNLASYVINPNTFCCRHGLHATFQATVMVSPLLHL